MSFASSNANTTCSSPTALITLLVQVTTWVLPCQEFQYEIELHLTWRERGSREARADPVHRNSAPTLTDQCWGCPAMPLPYFSAPHKLFSKAGSRAGGQLLKFCCHCLFWNVCYQAQECHSSLKATTEFSVTAYSEQGLCHCGLICTRPSTRPFPTSSSSNALSFPSLGIPQALLSAWNVSFILSVTIHSLLVLRNPTFPEDSNHYCLISRSDNILSHLVFIYSSLCSIKFYISPILVSSVNISFTSSHQYLKHLEIYVLILC